LRDSVSDAGPEIVAAELARHGRIEPPRPPIARLETTRPVAELLAQLAAALDADFYGSDRQVSPDAGPPGTGQARATTVDAPRR
jgi:hypothetical protein